MMVRVRGMLKELACAYALRAGTIRNERGIVFLTNEGVNLVPFHGSSVFLRRAWRLRGRTSTAREIVAWHR